jgi:hypothetical protein
VFLVGFIGQLTLLDRESATPERDSSVYLGSKGAEFVDFDAGYRMIRTEPMQCHVDCLAFYDYHPQLSNTANWLHKVLHEPLDEVRR